MGFDGLPDGLRHSVILTGNNLGQLAGLERLPGKEEALETVKSSEKGAEMLAKGIDRATLQAYAKTALDDNRLALGAALAVLSETV